MDKGNKKLNKKNKQKQRRNQQNPNQRHLKTFQECIKNKMIPKDTPKYLRKAPERALKEYGVGNIKHENQLFRIV